MRQGGWVRLHIHYYPLPILNKTFHTHIYLLPKKFIFITSSIEKKISYSFSCLSRLTGSASFSPQSDNYSHLFFLTAFFYTRNHWFSHFQLVVGSTSSSNIKTFFSLETSQPLSLLSTTQDHHRPRPTHQVSIGEEVITSTTKYRYLGSIIQRDGEIDEDINHRIYAGCPNKFDLHELNLSEDLIRDRDRWRHLIHGLDY